MDPVTGWYPDPAGQAQFRFWDGQNWTTATAPAPAAQQVAPQAYAPQQYAPQQYGQQQYAPQQGTDPAQFGQPVSHGGFQRAPEPRRSRRFYRVTGGVVAAVVTVAVGVPLALGSWHSGPTNGSLRRVLLTPAEAAESAGMTFTIDTSKDSSDDSNDSGNCPQMSDSNNPLNGKPAAEADLNLVDSSGGFFLAESIVYVPGQGAKLIQAYRAALASCHSLNFGGTTVAVTSPAAPAVPGSDDTIAMEMTGSVGTRVISIELEMARFGDKVVMVVFGGSEDAQPVRYATGRLLSKAAAKAQSSL